MPKLVPTMRPLGAPTKQETDRLYDRTMRNPWAKKFYNSTAWLKCRQIKLSRDPYCQKCLKHEVFTPATIVHHLKPITDFPELRLDIDNMESNCASCHSREHACSDVNAK
jgi:5-methylcytosine-specific restriction endonuclease McrA